MNYSSRFTQQKSKSDILDSKHKLNTHGKEMWTVLHTTSVFLPENPSGEQIETFSNFVKGILIFGTKFNTDWHNFTLEYIKNNPFSFYSRENSMLWLCNFHNNVNMKLERDLFECTKENISKRWGNFDKIIKNENSNYQL